MTFQNLPEGDKEIVSAIHHLLLANWIDAAGRAWQAYDAYGRGAIILDFRPYETPPDQLPFAGYARRQDVNRADENLAQLGELIDSYDPTVEIVCVIYTPLGDTVFERLPAFGGRPTPPKAALGPPPEAL